MLSLFLVFLLHYWETSGDKKIAAQPANSQNTNYSLESSVFVPETTACFFSLPS